VIGSLSRPRPSRASQPSSRISSRKPRLATAGNVRTVFALSPPTLVVRNSFLPGTGFLQARHLSRRHALQRAAGQAPVRCVRPMSASQTLDYDYPYSLAPGAVHETCASCVAMGFGTHHVTGGGDAHAASVFSASECRIGPCFEASDRAGGVIRRRGRCGRPFSSLSRFLLRFWLDLSSRLRVGPPGRETPRPFLPLPREQQRRCPIRDDFR
jgi:hypothetical protein